MLNLRATSARSLGVMDRQILIWRSATVSSVSAGIEGRSMATRLPSPSDDRPGRHVSGCSVRRVPVTDRALQVDCPVSLLGRLRRRAHDGTDPTPCDSGGSCCHDRACKLSLGRSTCDHCTLKHVLIDRPFVGLIWIELLETVRQLVCVIQDLLYRSRHLHISKNFFRALITCTIRSIPS